MSTTKAKPEQIYIALAAIMRDIGAIKKERTNSTQGFKFRGIDDIYNSLHNVFHAHGVLTIPFVHEKEHAEVGKTKNGAIIYRTSLVMGYKLIATDGSMIEARTAGEGFDSGDKSTAKAMSVAHKYLLLQMLLVPTDDIADGDFYDPTVMPREQLAELNKIPYTAEDLANLIAERDAIINRGERPDNILLGKISDAKLDVENPEDAAAARAEQIETERRMAAKGPQEPEDNLPGVEAPQKPADAAPAPKETQQQAAPTKAKPAKAPKKAAEPETGGPEWKNHVIQTITQRRFNGRKIGDLDLDELEFLIEKWADLHAEKIAAIPEKQREADLLRAALKARLVERKAASS